MSAWRFAAIVAFAAGCVGAEEAEVGSVSEAQSMCPAGGTLTGVDVSKYQGTVDFAKVAQAGNRFVITRMGDGMTVDPDFATNWAAAKSAGLYRGSYHYFRASLDPVQQADLFLDTVGTLVEGDLPPALDIETLDGETVAVTVTKMEQWLTRVQQATGRVPLIYSSPGFWATLGNPSLSMYSLWVANWEVTCPGLPVGWNNWSMWQSSSAGTVAGITGAVDLDVFNGTEAQLAALAGVTTPAPIASPDAGTDGGQVVASVGVQGPSTEGADMSSAHADVIHGGCSLAPHASNDGALCFAMLSLAYALRRRRARS